MKQINLLPKPRQQELRYEAVFYGLLIVFSVSVVSFALVFLAQFGTKFYLAAKSESVTTEINLLKSQVNKQENADLKKKITDINNLVTDFNNLSNAAPKWYKVIKAFTPLPPDGVSINSLSIDPNTKVMVINGFSPTRELVIQLYNNILQDSDQFYNIDYPLENVAKPTNISFHFTFYVKDDLLK